MISERVNALAEAEARAALARCCGSSRWVTAMLSRRPFADDGALTLAADEIWRGLDEADWLEAFAHHPRIGDVGALRARFAQTAAWAGAEQAGVTGAKEATILALAEGNRAYAERFGFQFLVCATGKSADQMLGVLRERLAHDRASELAIAAGEQAKITRLRLVKLVEEAAREAS